MDFSELVRASRSYRRFDHAYPVSRELLLELVDLARFVPCGMNCQRLRYLISYQDPLNGEIFSLLRFAALLKDWQGPTEDERPTAYIVVLTDSARGTGSPHDVGIAAQTIMLGACAKGLGGCIVAAFSKPQLSSLLGLPQELQPELVLALGKPAERVELRPMDATHGSHYWREGELHCVPKRSLDDLLVEGNPTIQ